MSGWVGTEIRLTHDGMEELGPGSFVAAQRGFSEPPEGSLLVKVHYASLDPSHRIWQRHHPTERLPAAGIMGEVVASASPLFRVGDLVTGPGTWSDLTVLSAEKATRFTPQPGVANHHAVGMLGLTGLTAYYGVTKVLLPQPGEKIVVSGAFGGVGQIACQLAVAAGSDVVGLVGGERKVAALEKAGIAALDYRRPEWLLQLDDWAPRGIDGFFDNVWGETAARVVERLRNLGRIAQCGQMSAINDEVVPALPLENWFIFLQRSLRLITFKAVDYTSENDQAVAEIARLHREGVIDQQVHMVRGWENAGEAFQAMLSGQTFGKLVVDVTS